MDKRALAGFFVLKQHDASHFFFFYCKRTHLFTGNPPRLKYEEQERDAGESVRIPHHTTITTGGVSKVF